MIKTRLLTAAAGLALAGCASFSQQAPASVHEALLNAKLPETDFAAVAFPLDARDTGLRINAMQPMQPASTMKVITAVVAFDQLGPNSRGHTELLADTPPQGDRLDGPLYLRGGADTDLDWGALWAMLKSVRDQGVREIGGGLVVDRTLFKPARLDIGAPQFDESPEFQYNAIPDALYLNGVMQNYVLHADAAHLTGYGTPAWPGLTVDGSAVTLTDDACAAWEKGWQIPHVDVTPAGPRVQLEGRFPKNCSQAPELNVLDRQWVTVAAVHEIWRELGGTLSGPDVEGATPLTAKVLAHHEGRAFAEMARSMMKSSDNVLARLTYLRLGALAAQTCTDPAAAGETTLAAAERDVRAWLTSKGIDATGLVLENGSGLSRTERITPTTMAALVAAAYDGRFNTEFEQTLPLAGYDGTLSRRLKGGPAEGRARLKTGTLHTATALAGYVPDSHGRLWVVAAMVNDAGGASKGRAALDALIEWVARQ